MEPRQLGPYRLLRRLGQGGMAEVYLAQVFGASGFEKLVTIKTLLPELRGRGDFERLLIEEARLCAMLQHQNLVQVHDLGVVQGVYFVRMDYVDGADLGTLAQIQRPHPALSLLIAEEIALALDYVHQARDLSLRPLGLVHRDISPSNILLSRMGEVKLADFGIAKATLLEEATRGNVRKGKYAYMSPEQVMGQPLSQKSDQFSFGVTLMELLCGSRPFDGETVLETMQRIQEAHPPDLRSLPPFQQGLIRRCLQRRPQDRFTSMEELYLAIRRARQSLPPVSPLDLGRWVRSRMEHREAQGARLEDRQKPDQETAQ